MADNGNTLDFIRDNDPLASLGNRPGRDKDKENEEEFCAAFGYLRGLHDRALAIEFRLAVGNRAGFPYQSLSSWRFNPSVGLLLKFTSDVTTLVLICGSNLDLMPSDKAINLLDRGIARQRITYIREMDQDELRRTGQSQPTIDRIHIEEFQSVEEQQEWLAKHAPCFVQK